MRILSFKYALMESFLPKTVFYRANAIVYFQGDKAEGIPILKAGKVELAYEDIQTGAEIREPIKTGEFFGVKAALGNYPHDEIAMAITDCVVIHFSIAEFEKFVAENPRILMKMLQVFSTQLRRIHNQVQNLLSADRINTNQEAGMFAIGEYCLKEKQYSRASYAFRSYLKHWPKGIYAPQAASKAEEAEASLHGSSTVVPEAHGGSRGPVLPTDNLDEIDAQYKAGRYREAMKGFLSVIRSEKEEAVLATAEFRIGCCLYHLDMFKEAAGQLVSAIRKYPNESFLGEELFYIGLCHKKLGETEKAYSFFTKAGELVPKGGTLYRQVLEETRRIRSVKGSNT